jgi:hypothetical protein
MTARARRAILAGFVVLYLSGVGFLCGLAMERMRFDGHRAAVLASLAAAQTRLHARLMALERQAQDLSSTPDR